jgi:hypothetical protein
MAGYYGQTYETMVNYFNTKGWQLKQIQGQPALRLEIDEAGNSRRCLAIAYDHPKQMIFYSIIPVQVQEDDIELQISELLHRINCGILIGNFTIDWFSGVIHCRTSVRVRSAIELNSALIEPVVNNNLALVSKYFPAILAVNEEEMSPTEALARLEPKISASNTITSPSSPNKRQAFEEIVNYLNKNSEEWDYYFNKNREWKYSQIEDRS